MSMRIIFLLPLLLSLTACLENGEYTPKEDLPENHPPISDTPNDNPNAGTSGITHKVRLGDRYYLKSVLESVFVSSSGSEASDTPVKNLVKQFIFDQGNVYSGTCSIYDKAECRSLSAVDYQSLPGLAVTSSSADAGFLNVCAEILDVNGVIDVLETKLVMSGTEDFDTALAQKAYELFYPGQTLNQEAYQNLLTLYQKSKSGGDRISGWKSVYYSFCISPQWRIP